MIPKGISHMNGLLNCFIINPAAGSGKGKLALVEKITEVCEKLGERYLIHFTEANGEATVYAKKFCEENPEEDIRFYSCGGDGTLNEVANGVIGCEKAQLAAIPAGTGNDFIKCFSDTENFADIERQLNAKPSKIDVIKFGAKYCMNLLNIGFDCNVVCQMNNIRKKIKVPNKLAYTFGLIKALFGKFGDKFSFSFDGEEPVEGQFLLSAFGNGQVYGGGYRATPIASLDDGLLDVCYVDKVSRPKFISLIGRYKSGDHVSVDNPVPVVHYKKCRKVSFFSEKPVGVCFDGEIELHDKIDIEIVPKAINFCIPDGSECLCLEKDIAVPEIYRYNTIANRG